MPRFGHSSWSSSALQPLAFHTGSSSAYASHSAIRPSLTELSKLPVCPNANLPRIDLFEGRQKCHSHFRKEPRIVESRMSSLSRHDNGQTTRNNPPAHPSLMLSLP